MSDPMSDPMSETEDATQFLTWNEFLAALGMPPALRELSERQMRYGICSEPDCQWPIAGWCVACRAKLCLDHLAEHRNLHARERLHTSERDELLAHLVDDGTISAEACRYCWGTGLFDPEDQSSGECMWCDGSGQQHSERSGSDGQQPEQATCPVCGTPGRRVTSRWWCDGCNLPFRRPGEAAGQE